MSVTNDGREPTILEKGSILIKKQKYRVALTERRIIFTGDSVNQHRSIPITAIRQVELDTDGDGNPLLKISAPSVHGEIKKVVLCFSKRDFPNAQELQFLWYSEIRKRIRQPVPVSSRTITENVSSEKAFCMQCGNRLVTGSIFCDRCGAKIPFAVQSFTIEQEGGSVTGIVVRPDVSPAEGDLPRKERSVSRPGKTGINTGDLVTTAPGREFRREKAFFAGSRIKKYALIIGICLAAGILIMAAIFVVLPSGSPVFNLTSTGLNVSLPGLSTVASPVSPEAIPAMDAEPPAPPANPEEQIIPYDTTVQPLLTAAPGDPGAVLAAYPALFNTGDGAGLYILLSENMKLHYPEATLNTELAAARSNGFSIQDIHIREQAVDDATADIETDFFWNIGGTPVTTSPRIFFVYENERWRLDNLILSPENL